MRRWLNFDVDGTQCVASLDMADGRHGLLIVSGGNEIRSGAHRGMARLAARIATAGYPVLRFDRRGVGDSEGDNGGFESSRPEIAAAVALLQSQCPALTSITAFGNCDAASALALHHAGAPIDGLILANPWLIDAAQPTADTSTDDGATLPPAAAIRARYLTKLRDPGEWLRLLGGGVDVRKLLRGLRAAGATVPSSLGKRVGEALGTFAGPLHILIADGDSTAQLFMAEWPRAAFASVRSKAAVHRHPTGSHSFADADSSDWLEARLLAALADK